MLKTNVVKMEGIFLKFFGQCRTLFPLCLIDTTVYLSKIKPKQLWIN